MEKYKIVGIKKRKNKEGKEYYLAYLTLETDNNIDLINVLLQDKQVQPLVDVMDDVNFDISHYLTLKYNSYQKVYSPVITYSL